MNYELCDKVYGLIKNIPEGKVLTYGKVAEMAGVNSPRLVGRILHENIDSVKIPCHRVVNSEGKVANNYAFGGGKVQRRKLEEEGIEFANNKIDLEKYLWK